MEGNKIRQPFWRKYYPKRSAGVEISEENRKA